MDARLSRKRVFPRVKPATDRNQNPECHAQHRQRGWFGVRRASLAERSEAGYCRVKFPPASRTVRFVGYIKKDSYPQFASTLRGVHGARSIHSGLTFFLTLRVVGNWQSRTSYRRRRRELVRPPKPRRRASVHINCRIVLDIFLAVATVVRHFTSRKVDIVPHNACAPRGRKELLKAAVSGVIGPERGNKCIPVERRNIDRAADEWRSLGCNGSVLCMLEALAGG
jgi:hypothetical protein